MCWSKGSLITASTAGQEHKYWEEAFQVYEKGVALFKYPHVRDIWKAYLSQFVERFGGSKLERARDLFRQALDMVRGPLAPISQTHACLKKADDGHLAELQSLSLSPLCARPGAQDLRVYCMVTAGSGNACSPSLSRPLTRLVLTGCMLVCRRRQRTARSCSCSSQLWRRSTGCRAPQWPCTSALSGRCLSASASPCMSCTWRAPRTSSASAR